MASPRYEPNLDGNFYVPDGISYIEIGQTQNPTTSSPKQQPVFNGMSSNVQQSYYNTDNDRSELIKLLESWQLLDLVEYFERK